MEAGTLQIYVNVMAAGKDELRILGNEIGGKIKLFFLILPDGATSGKIALFLKL